MQDENSEDEESNADSSDFGTDSEALEYHPWEDDIFQSQSQSHPFSLVFAQAQAQEFQCQRQRQFPDSTDLLSSYADAGCRASAHRIIAKIPLRDGM